VTPPEPRRNALERVGTIAPKPRNTPAAPALDPNFFRVRGPVPVALAAQHAIAAEDAIAFTPAPGDARAFERLRAAGVIREAGKGRYWLDLAAYHADSDARRRHLWPLALGGAVIVAALVVLFYRG